MIKEAIAQLVEHQPISGEQAYTVLSEIMSGACTDAQVAGFLTALRMVGESAEVIAGAARAMREACTPVPSTHATLVDTCGTGGDGSHTFNISTAAAFVTAGAGGAVAKHGNRGVSSKSGSADVLTALGVNIAVSPEVMTACLDELGIAFLFAPALHPAMKYAIGPRRELGIRTLFNILGPLTNPAGARRQVLGVYSAHLVPLMAHALKSLGAERAFVVHGEDGLDEITLTGFTRVGEVTPDGVREYTITPEEMGLPRVPAAALKGGEPEENAAIIRRIFEGEKGAARDIVVLNAAAALAAGGQADSIKAGIALAEEALDSGAAQRKLESLMARTTSA